MNVKEHIHPCDRANFGHHYERACGSPRDCWIVFTYNGSKP